MAKVGEVLRYRDAGDSVEEAKKKMFAAGEAPNGLKTLRNTPAAPAVTAIPVPMVAPVAPATVEEVSEFEDEIAASTPAPTPVIAPVAPLEPKVERVETDQFVGEIKRAGGQWVAEIKYKKSGGTERFSAASKNDLMLELLRGKGNATLRVHQAVRRERFGSPDLDKQYPLPEGTSVEDFEKMTDGQQNALLYTIATQELIKFRDVHPEFYQTPENAKKLNDFLAHYKPQLPITLRNLNFAYSELLADDELEKKPEASTPAPTISAPTPAPAQAIPTPAPAAPAPVSTAAPVTSEPAVVVRKRGTTGLQPGMSSSPSELSRPEDGNRLRELSEAELRRLPMPQLKRIADADRRSRAGSQR